ncbi:MAG TPA: glycoside hydrolase family 28 protein [Pyrinomonadaceae bacterium]|nr:glycoside hydrolase family 28 protein [Pyrinomonadaceae bacterium]
MRSPIRRLVAALVVVAFCQSLLTAQAAAQRGRERRRQAAASRAVGWEAVPAILARIRPPRFAARDFPVTDFGARPGEDSTEAIRRAVEACNRAGGGRVVVPAGTFLTGAVHLKSNVNLHVSRGATLRFITDPRKYLPVVFTRYEGTEVMNYSPLIYAFEQQNIAVTGEGTLDGGASDENWWRWARRGPGGAPSRQAPDVRRLREMAASGVPVEQRVFGEGYHLRPPFIQTYRSRNILVEGITIINSPFWEIHPVLSQNITVRRVNIRTHGPNNDGCDPESSRDVLIEDCVFDTGDDCIAIKSGRDDDGRRINVPSENIIVRNSKMKDGHGGVVIGSEISGGVRNVFVENCEMDSPNLDRALRFKSNARRGGVMENVFMRNVQIGRVAESVLTIDLVYFNEQGPYKPVVRNVQIENVTSTNSPRVMWVVGFPGVTIENVRFKDCTFGGLEAAEVVNHAGSISFENVRFEPARRGRSVNSPQAPPTQ